jgi:hypothetical protein
VHGVGAVMSLTRLTFTSHVLPLSLTPGLAPTHPTPPQDQLEAPLGVDAGRVARTLLYGDAMATRDELRCVNAQAVSLRERPCGRMMPQAACNPTVQSVGLIRCGVCAPCGPQVPAVCGAAAVRAGAGGGRGRRGGRAGHGPGAPRARAAAGAPPTHPLTHLLTHSLTHPLTHTLTHSLTHPLTHSVLAALHVCVCACRTPHPRCPAPSLC